MKIKNWKPKYYKTFWGWKRLKQPNFIVGGSSYNEGIEIDIKECSIHGKQVHIRCYNEGGHNATTLCIACANSIIKQIPNNLIDAIEKLEKLNNKRQKASLFKKRDEWDKKNNY